jgi:hypothetical protein
MPGVTSTSIAREAGRPTELPSTAEVARAAALFATAFAREIGADLTGLGAPGSGLGSVAVRSVPVTAGV